MDKFQLLASLESDYGLPNGLLKSVMTTESGGRADAVSPKGARGYFQFMPATAKAYGVNPTDFNSSATGAARMYADLLKQHNGDLDKALASYNWGSGNVSKNGLEKAPTETKNYITKVKTGMGGENMNEQEWELVKPATANNSANEWELVKPAQPKASLTDEVLSGARNLGAGAIRGAGSIGSTLLLPADMINQKLRGDDFFSMKDNNQRRAGIDEGLTQLTGSDPNSGLYRTGKIGAEIAGTSNIGGVIAKPLAGVAPRLANAISSGGFNLGTQGGNAGVNALTRVGGGAISGGATAGVVDPSTAGTGAVIGGALPIGVKGAAMLGSGIKKAAGGIASNTLGLTTGVGANSVKEAYKAGKSGNQAFIDNMRGDASVDDIVTNAKSALSKMNAAKQAEYRSGMSAISNDKTVLNFGGIDNALKSANNIASFKGKSTNTQASKAFDDIKSVIDEWKQLDPAEYHTPEGLDALKQKIGGIQESIPFEQKTARNVAGKIYNAIKDEISSQAPTYSKTMKDYYTASNQISEIEKALSLGKKANIDTSVRKLQSLMRNNVNSNYGNRLTLARELETKGGADLLPSIAGQAMNSWTPRGIQSGIVGGAGTYAAFTNPWTLAGLPLTSPRLVGETAYKLGSAAGGAGKLANPVLGNQSLAELQKLIATNPNLYNNLIRQYQAATTSQ